MDYENLTKDEALAQVELYREAKVENVPVFKKKADAIAWLIEQAKTLGTPHVVTQEDIDNNKDVENDLTLGEVVILPPPSDVPEATEEATEEVKPGVEPVVEEAKVTAPAEAQRVGQPTSATISVAPGPVQHYQGKVVLAVVNKIHNGKVYKEVTVPGSVSLLSETEFEQFVK